MSRTHHGEPDAWAPAERLEQARQAACSLESLLECVRAGEIVAASGLVARIEGAVLALRALEGSASQLL